MSDPRRIAAFAALSAAVLVFVVALAVWWRAAGAVEAPPQDPGALAGAPPAPPPVTTGQEATPAARTPDGTDPWWQRHLEGRDEIPLEPSGADDPRACRLTGRVVVR